MEKMTKAERKRRKIANLNKEQILYIDRQRRRKDCIDQQRRRRYYV
jgi:hypothetical protein